MSDFIVSARKYRPSTFDEVVGQEHVSQTLKNALRSGQLAHSFLFCGPRGVGKTTCARILAKVINCQNKTEEMEPCGTCESCVAFQKNASFNISELDAASNNSVDNIRSLVEQVRIPPQHGKYKVFIIDEVHMLSTAAFNAFLKTLEEPPPYAIFILATTEKHKIIPTILSRCQIYDFKRITIKDISSHLANIAIKEQIEAEPLALHVIAEKADGALRDALSIFDRLASGAKGQLTYQSVISQLNILDYEVYMKVTDALLLEDAALVLNILDDVIRRGFEPDVFILGLAEHIRNLMVAKEPTTIRLLEVSEELKDRYLAQSYTCSFSFLVSALDALNQCDIQYKAASNRRLHVEIALIKLVHIQSKVNQNSLTPSDQKKNYLIDLNSGERKLEMPREQKLDPTTQLGSSASTLNDKIIPAQVTSPIGSSNKTTTIKKSSLLIGPSIKKNIDFAKSVDEEEAINSQKECLLNLESMTLLWHRYADETTSPSLKSVMLSARLECLDQTVKVFVGSSLGRNMLLQETLITERIRNDLHVKDLNFEVILDPDLATEQEATTKPRTDKEKYEFLVNKNPLVEKLVRELKLKPEE